MSMTDRVCPVCEATIPAEAPVSLLHGEVLHKECFDTTMGAWPRSRPRPGRTSDGNGQDGAGRR